MIDISHCGVGAETFTWPQEKGHGAHSLKRSNRITAAAARPGAGCTYVQAVGPNPRVSPIRRLPRTVLRRKPIVACKVIVD